MRQVHVTGEKAFVHYSGKKPHIVDSATGEVIEVELFVGVLGASSYMYAEATETHLDARDDGRLRQRVGARRPPSARRCPA